MITAEQARENAQEVLDYIHAFPERHDQSDFYMVDGNEELELDAAVIEDHVCNTTMCIAGTVLFQNYGMDGLKKIIDEDSGFINFDTVNHAGELLGLNEQESTYLFFSTSNEEAVQALKKIIVGEEILDEAGRTLVHV